MILCVCVCVHHGDNALQWLNISSATTKHWVHQLFVATKITSTQSHSVIQTSVLLHNVIYECDVKLYAPTCSWDPSRYTPLTMNQRKHTEKQQSTSAWQTSSCILVSKPFLAYNIYKSDVCTASEKRRKDCEFSQTWGVKLFNDMQCKV